MKELKEAVWRANLALVEQGLVMHTLGNASGIDRAKGQVVIKPSGVLAKDLKPENLVVVALEDGKTVEGSLKPSVDTLIHLALYRAFSEIGAITHTHSLYATAWAQANKGIPTFGATHADYWFGDVPCTRLMTPREVKTRYEINTGEVIVERFQRLDYRRFPGVLVAGHGPFTWGKDPVEAVHYAVMLEHIARLASETIRISPEQGAIQPELREKHYLRKNGSEKYYGQG